MEAIIKDEAQLEAFIAQIRGEVIFPDHPDYNEVRKVYNGMIDKRPGMIVRCVDAADVKYAVDFGRENGLLIAVRGGGHNGGGLGICDDGMVIDLSGIKFVII